MSDNERNNDLSCLVLLTGKVLFCLIINELSATAGGAAVCQEWRLDKKWEEMSLIFL